MKQNDIHIVFGISARGQFVHSKKFDLDSVQLICLEDSLNLGPVCDLDSVEEIRKRSDWITEKTDDQTTEDGNRMLTFIENDIETIKALISNYKNEKIYLWTGVDASEIINTSRLLYHLQADYSNIFIFDFSEFSTKNIYGQTVYPRLLIATDLSRVDDIGKHFRQLKEEELSKFRKLWERVKFGNSLLWILDNGEITEKDETYFDSFLLSYLTKEFQSPARIIGQTLIDIDFSVGDSYLNHRLKQLVLTEEIEFQGELKQMRDYRVRLRQ